MSHFEVAGISNSMSVHTNASRPQPVTSSELSKQSLYSSQAHVMRISMPFLQVNAISPQPVTSSELSLQSGTSSHAATSGTISPLEHMKPPPVESSVPAMVASVGPSVVGSGTVVP